MSDTLDPYEEDPKVQMLGLIDAIRREAEALIMDAKSQSPCEARATVATAQKLRRQATGVEASVLFFLEWELRDEAPPRVSRSNAYGSTTVTTYRKVLNRCRLTERADHE